ncbi:MAG: amidohydrolase family protein [Chloroflexota bacterium]
MSLGNIEIVDAHVHLFPSKEVGRQVVEMVKATYGTPYYCTGSPDELDVTMHRAGITRAVAMNQAGAGEKALNWLVSGNFFVCAYSKKHPELIPAIGLDKKMKRNPAQEIDHKLRWDARAVKLHPMVQKFYVNDRAMWPIYEKCEAVNLPIIFHSGKMMVKGLPDYARPDLFQEVLKAFPKLKVVLAHMGGGFWKEALKLAHAFPQNVFFDTAIAVSGAPIPDFLRLTDEMAVKMIREIGAHRVMFGSDFPWIDPTADIERIKSLPLTDEEKQMILGENALKFFKSSKPSH